MINHITQHSQSAMWNDFELSEKARVKQNRFGQTGSGPLSVSSQSSSAAAVSDEMKEGSAVTWNGRSAGIDS